MKEIIYCHEHITLDLSQVKNDKDYSVDIIEETISEFKELKSKGVSTIVDLTNIGMGRDPEYVNEVMVRSGIKVLQSTGYYKKPFFPQEVFKLSSKELSNIFIDEIVNGIDGIYEKASIIGEVGTGFDFVDEEELKVLEAAARASFETGAPIATHTTRGKLGIEQLEVFKKYNVDLNKVTIGHLDLSTDLEYILRVLDNGVNIAFDKIGRENVVSDSHRIEMLKKLCDRGHSDRILLSMDIDRKSRFKTQGGVGYSYLVDTFVPKLEEVGIREKDILNMTSLNAKRIYNIK